MEGIVFLYGKQPLEIKILQLPCDQIHVAHCFGVAPEPPDGHGDESLLLNSQCERF